MGQSVCCTRDGLLAHQSDEWVRGGAEGENERKEEKPGRKGRWVKSPDCLQMAVRGEQRSSWVLWELRLRVSVFVRTHLYLCVWAFKVGLRVHVFPSICILCVHIAACVCVCVCRLYWPTWGCVWGWRHAGALSVSAGYARREAEVQLIWPQKSDDAFASHLSLLFEL